MQRVEPAARLVDGLADEVGGEAACRTRLDSRAGSATARRASRRSRTRQSSTSGTRFIAPPHFAQRSSMRSTYGRCRSSRASTAAGSVARSRISAREPMRVVGAARVAEPQRQRRAPVALAAERPVDVVAQPVAEAPALDVLGVPVDPLVAGDQLVLAQRSCGCTSSAWRSRAAACRSASRTGTCAGSSRERSSRPRCVKVGR